MNKKLIWTIVAIVIIILAVFVFMQMNNPKDTNGKSGESESLDSLPDSEFSNLESSDEVFSEIDNSLNYIE